MDLVCTDRRNVVEEGLEEEGVQKVEVVDDGDEAEVVDDGA